MSTIEYPVSPQSPLQFSPQSPTSSPPYVAQSFPQSPTSPPPQQKLVVDDTFMEQQLRQKETNEIYYKKLDQYFKLKQKYEKKLTNSKNSILKNEDLNKKQKIKRIRNLKPTCINCKKPVGTVFEIDDGVYKAYCGSTTSPCKLNIELKRQQTINMYEYKNDIQNDIRNKQNDMIISKFQLLFGFMNEDEMVDIYKVIKQQYTDDLEFYNLLDNLITSISNSKEKKTNINNYQKIYYDDINTIKKGVREYLTTNNIALVKDAIETYLNVRNAQENIRNNKYESYFVETNENKHYLIKNKINIENREHNVDEPEIISFVTK
jgi:hypothetical protein